MYQYSFLFIAGKNSVVCVDRILLLCLSVVDIWVFPSWAAVNSAAVNSAAMNIYVQVFAHLFSGVLGVCLGVELLSDMVILCLTD